MINLGQYKTCPISQLHQAAIELACRGFMVFPLKPNSKIALTECGVMESTRDISIISNWWLNEPHANIGISTSCLIVLDVDHKDGIDGFQSLKDLVNKYGELTNSLTQKTPSGGVHIIFNNSSKIHVPSRKNCPADGIDSRCSDGYIVAAPSSIDRNTYVMSDYAVVEAPKWLSDLIRFQPLNLNIKKCSLEGNSRKRFLFDVARECRRRSVSIDNAIKILSYSNSKCNPQLNSKELEMYLEIACFLD